MPPYTRNEQKGRDNTQPPDRHPPTRESAFPFLRRLCAGLVVAGSLMIGGWHAGQGLLPLTAGRATGQALLLLGCCLLGLAGLTACLGVGKNMTLRQVAARYRALHGWIGIMAGSLLAMGFLAGTFTLFAGPLQQWSTPPLPEQTLAPTSQALPLSLLPSHPTSTGDRNGTKSKNDTLPTAAHYRLILAGNPATARLSLSEGPELPLGLPAPQLIPCQPVPQARCAYRLLPSPVPAFIGGLHRRLGLPVPEAQAMPLVGLLCLFYGLALLSGVILLLPGLWRTLMTVRPQGHARRLWLDLHSLLGLCSLPFQLIIALTTALCAFSPLLPELTATHTSTTPAITMQMPPQTPGDGPGSTFRHGTTYPAHPMADGPVSSNASFLAPMAALSRLHALSPGFQPLMLDYVPAPHAPDSQSLHIALHAPLYDAGEAVLARPATRPYLLAMGSDHLAPLIGRDRATALLDPHDGTLLSRQNLPGQQTAARRLLTWCMALHFGSFGGEFVRWLYALLGICGVGFFHTANQLWLNSHRHKQAGQAHTGETPATLWLGRLSEGGLLGCLLGLCLLTLASPLMVHLHPLPKLTGQADMASFNSPAPFMVAEWWRAGFIHYGSVTCVILARCLLPPRLCRGLVCLLSAVCLSAALILAAFRHAITQSPATLSLSGALALASLALWGASFHLLCPREQKHQTS